MIFWVKCEVNYWLGVVLVCKICFQFMDFYTSKLVDGGDDMSIS